MDQGIKMSLRNFKSHSSLSMPYTADSKDNNNISNTAISILSNLVDAFNKKQCVISIELEEMKKEIVHTITCVSNLLSLKEIKKDSSALTTLSPENKSKSKKYIKTVKSPNKKSYSPLSLKSDKLVPKEKIVTFFNNGGVNTVANYDSKKLYPKRSSFPNKRNKTSKSMKSLNTKSKSPSKMMAKMKDEELLSKDKLKFGISNEGYRNEVNLIKSDKDVTNKKITVNKLGEKKVNVIYKHSWNKQSLSSKVLSALNTVALSPVTPMKDKIRIAFLNKELYYSLTLPLRADISNRLTQLQNELNDPLYIQTAEKLNANEDIMNYPSKTAQIQLLLLPKEKEELCYNNQQLYQIIYFLCNNEQSNDISDIPSHFNTLLSSHKVDTIKSLFLQCIYDKVFIRGIISKSNSMMYNKQSREAIVNMIKTFIDNKENNELLVYLRLLFIEIIEQFEYIDNNPKIVSYIEKKKEEKQYVYVLNNVITKEH